MDAGAAQVRPQGRWVAGLVAAMVAAMGAAMGAVMVAGLAGCGPRAVPVDPDSAAGPRVGLILSPMDGPAPLVVGAGGPADAPAGGAGQVFPVLPEVPVDVFAIAQHPGGVRQVSIRVEGAGRLLDDAGQEVAGGRLTVEGVQREGQAPGQLVVAGVVRPDPGAAEVVVVSEAQDWAEPANVTQTGRVRLVPTPRPTLGGSVVSLASDGRARFGQQPGGFVANAELSVPPGLPLNLFFEASEGSTVILRQHLGRRLPGGGCQAPAGLDPAHPARTGPGLMRCEVESSPRPLGPQPGIRDNSELLLRPEWSTTYLIEARNAVGSTHASVFVNVERLDAPRIRQFALADGRGEGSMPSPATVLVNQRFGLSWCVEDVVGYAEGNRFSGGGGGVWVVREGPDGSRLVFGEGALPPCGPRRGRGRQGGRELTRLMELGAYTYTLVARSVSDSERLETVSAPLHVSTVGCQSDAQCREVLNDPALVCLPSGRCGAGAPPPPPPAEVCYMLGNEAGTINWTPLVTPPWDFYAPLSCGSQDCRLNGDWIQTRWHADLTNPMLTFPDGPRVITKVRSAHAAGPFPMHPTGEPFHPRVVLVHGAGGGDPEWAVLPPGEEGTDLLAGRPLQAHYTVIADHPRAPAYFPAIEVCHQRQ